VVVSGIDAAYDMCHGGERILFFARIVNIFFDYFVTVRNQLGNLIVARRQTKDKTAETIAIG